MRLEVSIVWQPRGGGVTRKGSAFRVSGPFRRRPVFFFFGLCVVGAQRSVTIVICSDDNTCRKAIRASSCGALARKNGRYLGLFGSNVPDIGG